MPEGEPPESAAYEILTGHVPFLSPNQQCRSNGEFFNTLYVYVFRKSRIPPLKGSNIPKCMVEVFLEYNSNFGQISF